MDTENRSWNLNLPENLNQRDKWSVLPIPADIKPHIAEIWTDASFNQGSLSGGGGIIWVDHVQRELYCHNFHIPRVQNSTQAELITVAVACLLAPCNTRLTLYCDNKTVAGSMHWYRWKHNKDLGRFIFNICEERNLEIDFTWVKAHVGISLNERADVEANKGATSHIRADLYKTIRSHMNGFFWTDGISCDPDISSIILLNERDDVERSRTGYDTIPEGLDIHDFSHNHWKSIFYNFLHSNVLIKSRLDIFNNRNNDGNVVQCFCGEAQATLKHMITECVKTANLRHQTLTHIYQTLADYHFQPLPTIVWEDQIISDMPDTIYIGWRGIVTKDNFAKLTRAIPTFMLPIDNGRNRSLVARAFIDEISTTLANHIYQAYKISLPYYHQTV